jgi:hypothetical protein
VTISNLRRATIVMLAGACSSASIISTGPAQQSGPDDIAARACSLCNRVK